MSLAAARDYLTSNPTNDSLRRFIIYLASELDKENLEKIELGMNAETEIAYLKADIRLQRDQLFAYQRTFDHHEKYTFDHATLKYIYKDTP